MKKILLAGDFNSNDGVANANKRIKMGLNNIESNNIYYFTTQTNKVFRFIELLILLFKVDIVCMCGVSLINNIILLMNKFLKLKLVYLLHGYPPYELKVEGEIDASELQKITRNEEDKLNNVDLIVCVSKTFTLFFNDLAPKYKEKTTYIYNPADINLNNIINETRSNKNFIISTGGGRRIKNNLRIAQAISEINAEYKLNLKFILLGKKGPDYQKIISYPCVEFVGSVSYQEALKYYSNSKLYIQNSYSETFGLAIVESLMLGCDLLMSYNIGVRDILTDINESDIIYNNNSLEEIKNKILYVLNNPNNKRIKSGINFDLIDPLNVAKDLEEKLVNY